MSLAPPQAPPLAPPLAPPQAPPLAPPQAPPLAPPAGDASHDCLCDLVAALGGSVLETDGVREDERERRAIDSGVGFGRLGGTGLTRGGVPLTGTLGGTVAC